MNIKKRRGNPKLDEVRHTDVSAANCKRKELADNRAREIAKMILKNIRESGGGLSFAAHARWLNEHGYRTSRGKLFSGKQVSRIFKRFIDGVAKAK